MMKRYISIITMALITGISFSGNAGPGESLMSLRLSEDKVKPPVDALPALYHRMKADLHNEKWTPHIQDDWMGDQPKCRLAKSVKRALNISGLDVQEVTDFQLIPFEPTPTNNLCLLAIRKREVPERPGPKTKDSTQYIRELTNILFISHDGTPDMYTFINGLFSEPVSSIELDRLYNVHEKPLTKRPIADILGFLHRLIGADLVVFFHRSWAPITTDLYLSSSSVKVPGKWSNATQKGGECLFRFQAILPPSKGKVEVGAMDDSKTESEDEAYPYAGGAE